MQGIGTATKARGRGSPFRVFATFSYENGAAPRVGPNVFLAPTSAIVGNVTIGKNSSIWYNCVLRGDVNEVSIHRADRSAAFNSRCRPCQLTDALLRPS